MKMGCRRSAIWRGFKKDAAPFGCGYGEEFSNERDVNGYTDA